MFKNIVDKIERAVINHTVNHVKPNSIDYYNANGDHYRIKDYLCKSQSRFNYNDKGQETLYLYARNGKVIECTTYEYNEKGERIIGNIELTAYLKRPRDKIFQEENSKFMSSMNKIINNSNNNINKDNNNNNNINNININQSPMKEFIIGQPAIYNNNIIDEENNINNNNIKEQSENGEEKLQVDDGMEKIRTDINGDILILYLKINELKSSNDLYNPENSINNNINNNLNEQINNLDKNKNIIFYNYTGPQLPRHNFFLRHKIFPENKDATSEIIWNKISPNFNYSIQMPFTLNQKTVELLDNGKFLVEIWTKGENNNNSNNNSCLGFVSFDLKNVLDSLKVNENTITTLQLYKNTLPYIIYDDFYQVTQINENSVFGNIFLKVCIGIGSSSQINNFEKLINKINNQNKNQQSKLNGMYNSEKNNDINNKEKNDMNNKNENNMSLDPFKEDIKEINKEELNENNQSNISKAAEINVEQIFEKNKKNLDLNNNINNMNNNISKESLKKSESFEDNISNKKKIMNPFLVPQNYEKENDINKNSIKETGKFTKLLNNDINTNINANTNEFNSQNNNFNFESSNRYNNPGTFNNNNYNNYNTNEYQEKKEEEKNEFDKNNNNDINKEENKFNYLNELNKSNKNEENEEYIEENIQIEKDNQDNNNFNININQKNEEDNNNDINAINKEKNNDNLDLINIDNNNKNELDIINNEEKNENLNINKENKENIDNYSSFVKKHIFTISIEKIYNCQILSKLPSAYLRYQFFTDQKPLRSEFFTFSQFAVDSSVIDVDMKSMHSIILPKVEKIKDYLNDFLVEFLYDIPNKKNSNIIIGRVNIPSDEFAALIGEKEHNNKNMNEISRVLFIYGTEKIQRNKCIIGKLKLSFKYTNIDVPINNNLYLNGSLMNSSLGNNNNLNNINNTSPNFAGSIYLEKETIFNRKIPKNAVLKINVEKFSSTPLFEDYFRKQFSIYFVFSIFGEVNKMENQYGKRATSKKHNLLNCEFGENLIYKIEIDQDIIDYLKCRNGIVYLVYKISKEKNEENNNDINEKEDLNLIDFENSISKNKKIIGKGVFNLNEILTSADTNYKEISISQIGNGSMSLGVLNIALNLENDNSGLYTMTEENVNKKILSNTTSDLYKLHNISFNKCEPSLYLNGKFLFSINFTKFYYEINSEIGNIINNSNFFYFVFKLGNKIKKISPKFSQENELFSLNINSNLILINYVEMIELNLNFNKKLPNDLYNLFNEGILEIKLYQSDNANALGSFYVDLHKLIVAEFFSENVLYTGNNVINLINVNNNTYKNCKIEINLAIFKLNENQVNTDLVNKINYLSNNLRKESGNVNENNNNSNLDNISNLDYCEYYQNLFVKDYTDYIIQNLFFDNNNESNKDKDKENINNINNMNVIEINGENILTIEKIKKVLNFNNIDMFNFINTNIINLLDNKGELNLNNFKKVFNLITKLNLDVFDFYYENSSNNNFTSNTFDYYLNSRIINLDNEDSNIINFLKDKQNKVDIGINSNSLLNVNNNKTIKKLLTVNYNYGFNETNDYLDVVSLCLFIFDYFYNLNNEIIFNILKIKITTENYNTNNTYSKTQPLIYKKEPEYFNHTVYNMNSINLNNINKANKISNKPDSKIMLISVLSGHNIIKPNSDFTSRPNCYFILEFDDKNYTSDVVMNTSQPNFNEELEIKINSEEYLQKLNALNIFISVYSFVDENNSILIGKCEINPAKMFPFLNEQNECEDFFHIIGEEGQVMGQLDLKFKFDKDSIEQRFKYSLNNTSDNLNNNDINNNYINNKKNNNTISYPINNVFEKNNSKKNFLKTGGDGQGDALHKRLQEAMNSIDDLTQILKEKVENEKNNNNNNNLNDNFNVEEMAENYNEEEMFENYEEQIENEENNFEENNENINDNGNNINNNINNINNLNNNEYDNKTALTDFNNLNNSQKISENGEENEKASFYSEKNEKDKKMKYLKNYDKNLLNKIQKIMKNKK